MNNNEAIARLQAAADIAIATGCELAKMPAMDALAIADLLKEQEPVKPKRVLGVLPDCYHCGVCGMDMLDTGDGYRPKYCPQCGRAVKWDEHMIIVRIAEGR